MAHGAQQEFIRTIVNFFPDHFEGRVLDIGSLDINGDVTHHFNASEYVGVDIGPGNNVNLVARGEELDLESNYFDVVISGECFEHNPAWKSTFSNMVRMLRPGGVIVITCASTLRTEHGTTRSDLGAGAPLSVDQGYEYYGNVTPRQLLAIIDESLFSHYRIYQNWAESDLYFVGLKAGGHQNYNLVFSQTTNALKALIKKYNKPYRVITTQYRAFEWRWKLKIVKKLISILGEARYRKFRRYVSFLGL